MEQKRFEEAVECFDKAIATDSRTPIAYNNKGTLICSVINTFAFPTLFLASAYIRMKKYDEALDCLVTALRLDPYYDRAHTNKGIVFIYQVYIMSYHLLLNPRTDICKEKN